MLLRPVHMDMMTESHSNQAVQTLVKHPHKKSVVYA